MKTAASPKMTNENMAMGEGSEPMTRMTVPMAMKMAPMRWEIALKGSRIFATSANFTLVCRSGW